MACLMQFSLMQFSWRDITIPAPFAKGICRVLRQTLACQSADPFPHIRTVAARCRLLCRGQRRRSRFIALFTPLADITAQV